MEKLLSKKAGENLKKFSKENNISPGDIQNEMNISSSTYYDWCNKGIRDVDVVNTFKEKYGYNLLTGKFFVSENNDSFSLQSEKEMQEKIKEIKKKIESESNLVIYDENNLILNEIGDYLEEKGYAIKVLNLCDPTNSHCYNPLSYVEDDLEIQNLASFLIDELSIKDEDDKNKMFQKTLLESCLHFLIKYWPRKDEQTFTSVMKLLRAAKSNEQNPNAKSKLDRIFDEVEKPSPIVNSVIIKQYSIYKQLSIEEQQKVIANLQNKLKIFNINTIEKLTNEDNIHLNKCISGKKVVLFVCYSSFSNNINYLYRILSYQLANIYSKQRDSEINFLYYPEDVKPIFENLYSKSKKSYKIKQDYLQIDLETDIEEQIKEIENKQKIKNNIINKIKGFPVEAIMSNQTINKLCSQEKKLLETPKTTISDNDLKTFLHKLKKEIVVENENLKYNEKEYKNIEEIIDEKKIEEIKKDHLKMQEELSKIPLFSDENIINILLRDTLLSINKKTHTICQINLEHGLWDYDETCVKFTKLNLYFHYDKFIKKIENQLRIKIDGFVDSGLYTIADIVDIIGGISVPTNGIIAKKLKNKCSCCNGGYSCNYKSIKTTKFNKNKDFIINGDQIECLCKEVDIIPKIIKIIKEKINTMTQNERESVINELYSLFHTNLTKKEFEELAILYINNWNANYMDYLRFANYMNYLRFDLSYSFFNTVDYILDNENVFDVPASVLADPSSRKGYKIIKRLNLLKIVPKLQKILNTPSYFISDQFSERTFPDNVTFDQILEIISQNNVKKDTGELEEWTFNTF